MISVSFVLVCVITSCKYSGEYHAQCLEGIYVILSLRNRNRLNIVNYAIKITLSHLATATGRLKYSSPLSSVSYLVSFLNE